MIIIGPLAVGLTVVQTAAEICQSNQQLEMITVVKIICIITYCGQNGKL